MKSKIICLFVFTVLLYTLSLAINNNAGTSGFQFMKMSYSARALGMSNAFTALSDDVDAVYFNPAGLIQCHNEQIKSNYINYLDGMNGGSVAYLITDKKIANLAFFGQYLNSGDIKKTELLGENNYIETGNFSASELLLGISLAKQINEVLDIGFTAKYNLEQLDDTSASALAFDFGILHQTNNKKLLIGAVFKNAGLQLSYFTDNKYKEKMPMEASLGARYTYNEKMLILTDLNKPLDNDLYAKIGFEYGLMQNLTLRTGFDSRAGNYKANGNNESYSGLSAGFGVKYKNYGVDYGLASKGDLGWINELSLSIKL